MQIEKIKSPEILESENFICYPVSDRFKDDVHSILKNETIRNNILSPVLKDREQFEVWWQGREKGVVSREILQWCAYLKSNQKFCALLTIKEINTLTHRAEIGYSLLPQYWRKGYGFELVTTLVEYGFNGVGFHTLFAQILPGNIGSQRIVQKLGFEQEGHFKDFHFYKNEYHDLLQFGKMNPSDK